MRIVGVTFIVIASGTVGFQMAAMLRKRCNLMRELDALLQLLKNEIEVCGTPLPQAFALMAASADGVLETLFASIAKEMDKNRWTTPLDAAEAVLRQLYDKELSELLIPLMKKLGKYDIQAQIQGISVARLQINEILSDLEKERKMKSKTFQTLGICTGLAVAILLI